MWFPSVERDCTFQKVQRYERKGKSFFTLYFRTTLVAPQTTTILEGACLAVSYVRAKPRLVHTFEVHEYRAPEDVIFLESATSSSPLFDVEPN